MPSLVCLSIPGADVDDALRRRAAESGPVSLLEAAIHDAARLLADYPDLNGYHDGERAWRHRPVSVGFAMNLGRSLRVPVVRDAGTLSLLEVARAVRSLSLAYMRDELTIADQTGGTFTVTVKGAKTQLGDLIQKVVNASQLPSAAKTLLIAKLNALLASFDPGNTTQRQAVCLALQVFKAAVQLQAGKTIPQAQAVEWIADANRIRAVLGC